MAKENNMGRPTAYRPEYCRQARKLCTLGATDVDLADFFGVDVRTVQRWRAAYPDFRRAVKTGKKPADENVVRSLYLRATGYAAQETKVFKLKDPETRCEYLETVEVTRHYPPDTAAAFIWLKNRLAKEWRDKVEVGVDDESMQDLFAKLAESLPV